MSRFVIRLENLSFYARIGVEQQERIVGNEFAVDITACCNADVFADEDLDSTVSYAEIYDIVAEEMHRPRLLLETVAREIGERLRRKYEVIESVSVKIVKKAPPIPGIQGSASVEYQS